MQPRGLGKALSELLPNLNELNDLDVSKALDMGRGQNNLQNHAGSSETTGSNNHFPGRLLQLGVDCLKPGRYQPRKQMDDEPLEELTASIRAQGIIQPILVRPLADHYHYEIVAGERRWRAAQKAGLTEVPVLVKELTDGETLALALIENLQRQDLNAIEEAVALQRLLTEFGMTHQEAADAIGRSRVAVTNLLRLLSLNPDVRQLLEEKHIEMGHARAMLALAGWQQSDAAKQVVKRELSVRQTEQLVKQIQQQANGPVTVTPLDQPEVQEPSVRQLTQSLGERLGAKVEINHRQDGKGRLVVHYHSLDELEGILAHIQ